MGLLSVTKETGNIGGKKDLKFWNRFTCSNVAEYMYPENSVPNVNNICTGFLTDIISEQGKCVLLIGEQGTAKTVMNQSCCTKYKPK